MDFRKQEVSTGLIVEKRTFRWRIKNFDVIRCFDGLIDGQEFSFKAGETIGLETEWRLYLTAGKSMEGEGNEDNEQWIGIWLWCTKRPKGVNKVIAGNQFFIVSENRDSTKVVEELKMSECVRNYATYIWGTRNFIRKDGKIKADGSPITLIDGCLVLEMDFHLYAPITPPAILTGTLNRTGSVVKLFEPIFMTKLQSDLESLLNSSSQTFQKKVKIVSNDGKEFEVNGGILSVRSPVFEKMLETDMKEANTGVISIDDLSSKTIAVLLRFIYTGKLHEDWSKPDVIVSLLYAAAKYQLSDLMEFLDNVLGEACSQETANQLFNLASMLGMEKATQEIRETIKKDFLNESDMRTSWHKIFFALIIVIIAVISFVFKIQTKST